MNSITEEMIEAGARAMFTHGEDGAWETAQNKTKTFWIGYAEECLTAALSAGEAVQPVAWQPRYTQEVIDHHRSQGADFWEYAMTVYPTKEAAEGYGYGGHEVRALYLHPSPASAGVVGEWQDASTAPNQEMVLVCDVNWPAALQRGEAPPIKVGYLDICTGAWRIFGASWRPTHWMPLPAAPAEEGERG